MHHTTCLARHCKDVLGSVLRPTISELSAKWNSRVPRVPLPASVDGYITSVRRQKSHAFFVIQDGTGSVQVHVDSTKYSDTTEGLKVGASVTASGSLCAHPRTEEMELSMDNLTVYGDVARDYPFQSKSEIAPPKLLTDYPHLRLRHPDVRRCLEKRADLGKRVDKILQDMSFQKLHMPVLTGMDTESSNEKFHLRDIDTGLTVSTQLHLEAAAYAWKRVYSLGPVFRNAESHGKKHLTEFWMLEVEMAFMRDLKPLMSFTEQFIRSLLDPEGEMGDATPWPRVEYDRAVAELGLAGEDPVIGRDEEMRILQRYGTTDSRDGPQWPVFLTRFPSSQKPFYMARTTSKPDRAECFDLLMPSVGEVIGGSLREHDPSLLRQQIEQSGLALPKYEWYVALRKHGSAPTAGFGMGLERALLAMGEFGRPVKDFVAFPRMEKSIPL